MSPPQTRHITQEGITVCVVLAIIGSFFVRGLIHVAYAESSHGLGDDPTALYETYAAHVAAETDVAHLAQVGENLLQKKMPAYAALNFKRASDLDLNFRDAAYGWALSVAQDKQNSLTSSDLAAMHQAIDRAEVVDPLYAPVLQLQLALAQYEQQADVVAATQDRLALVPGSQPAVKQ